MNTPRGIRNHNPGNIERDGTPWRGLAADQSGDPRFCVFTGPEYGLRALGKVLLTYQRRHGISTVRGIIHRWAPPQENDTAAYVTQVAHALGVGPDQPIEVSEPGTLATLMRAIVRHENGQMPYPPETIAAGVRMALE